MKTEFGQDCFGDEKFTQGNIHMNLFPKTKEIEGGFCFAISMEWLITCMTDCRIGSNISPISAWSAKCEGGYPFFLNMINEFRTYLNASGTADDYNVIVRNFVANKGYHITGIGNGRIPNVSLACNIVDAAVANSEANLIALRSKEGNHAVAMFTFGGVGYWYDPNFGVFRLSPPYNAFMQQYWSYYTVDDMQFSHVQ